MFCKNGGAGIGPLIPGSQIGFTSVCELLRLVEYWEQLSLRVSLGRVKKNVQWDRRNWPAQAPKILYEALWEGYNLGMPPIHYWRISPPPGEYLAKYSPPILQTANKMENFPTAMRSWRMASVWSHLKVPQEKKMSHLGRIYTVEPHPQQCWSICTESPFKCGFMDQLKRSVPFVH